MANLKENTEWVDGIYQLETTDPVMGGPNGIDNLQAKQLANRTQFLKQSLDNLANKVTNVANSIPIVPVQSVNGKTGDINITAADVNALTREQALNEFLPASKKVGNDEQPIYEVGEHVVFSKRPRFNESELITKTDYTYQINGETVVLRRADGLIIQRFIGQFYGGHGTNGTIVTLPIAFPNNFYIALANDGAGGCHAVTAVPVSLSTVKIYGKNRGDYTDSLLQITVIGR